MVSHKIQGEKCEIKELQKENVDKPQNREAMPRIYERTCNLRKRDVGQKAAKETKRREARSQGAIRKFFVLAVQQVRLSHEDKVKCNALDSVGTANETSFLKVELSGICGITGVFG
jgi:hypothetical protein